MASKKDRKKNKNQVEEEETTQKTTETYKGIFSALKDQYYTDKPQKSALENLQQSFGSGDLGEIGIIFQRLNKKSDATKIKSFKDLKDVLLKKEEDFYGQFLLTWSVIYEKLIISETDSRIQMGVQDIMSVIIDKGKKALMKQFPKYYAAWFLSMHDMNQDVKAMAKKNFNT